MQILNKYNQLTIDLFHGTSTLFLDSIVSNGLGGVNPVSEWNILGLCKEVCEFSDQHLKETKLYQRSFGSLKRMAEQTAAETFNFQHGDTYVSPSQQTAVRYAINKRFGSEILTYTIDFLQELIKKEIPYVTQELYRKYLKIYGLIESNPSPLLVKIKDVPISALVSEGGQDPTENLNELNEAFINFDDRYELFVQQHNFRLIKPVPKANLELYLINIQKYSQLDPKYNFYKIETLDFK
ncbi:MAG: hypothetical protein JNL60_13555 [Bacteroidia bacterium]|nr:hypothetical protein [Bacteroidia bacterium]